MDLCRNGHTSNPMIQNWQQKAVYIELRITPTSAFTPGPPICVLAEWIAWDVIPGECLESTDVFRRPEVKGVGFWGGTLIFFPHFYRLVSFACYKPWTSHIIGTSINTSFTVEWSCQGKERNIVLDLSISWVW